MTQLRAQSSLRVLGISAIILLLGASAAPKDPLVADAAMRGDVATVRRLISQHTDVNTPQGDGMTALHWAAERGDTALTTALIKAHANVKALTRIGNYTPLLIAAKSGNPAVISALVKAGSDVNAATSNGTSVLHFAAAAGDPKAIEELIARGANVNARDSAWGRTPLIFAAEKDRAAAITVLMKHGADATVRSKYEGVQEETARDQAATKKRNEVLIAYEPEKHKTDSADAAKAAAQAAADAAAGGFGGFAGGGRRGNAGPQPKGPFTPEQMQHAIEEGRKVLLAPAAAKGPVTEEVDTLNGGIAGFGNSVGGVGGLSALHHAARNGNIAAAMALLDGGAPIDERNMADSTTPLLLAIINGQFDVAMKLVERGADVNTESTIAMTPLYAAINTQWAPKSRYPQPQAVQNQRTGYLELMEALLKKGANPNVRLTAQPWYFAFNNCGNANCGLENIEGTTSFWRAAYAVDVDAMKLLVDHGADPNLPSQRMQTQVAAGRGRGGRGGRGGGGAGGAAGDSTRAGAASAFARGGGGGRGGPQLPLDPRVDSAAKVAPVGLGVYAIHAAAGVGYGNGFAGNSHRHAPDGWMPAMKYLVEVLHADVNARDQQGMTPLHHAAARGDNEMILYLVAHGADPKAVSRTGRTTVDMANGPVQRLRPFPETIALLEKLGAINQHHCVSC